jgi:hypothetical protein
MLMRCAAAFLLLLSVPALAQVNSRPTDPPIVTAENESWYRLGEPLTYAGTFYYPTGAVTFFNGNVMVRTGHYNGVPLYADTTIEPYSIVFVPIGRGQMQPYERVRDGDLAGTSGSRPPSFPGRSARSGEVVASAPGAPTNAPLPIGAIGVFTADPGAAATTGVTPATARVAQDDPSPRRPGRPFRYDSISVQFNGAKWVMAGPSITSRPAGVRQVAEYKGFPVYAVPGRERELIYLPITADRLAPFKPGAEP